MSFARLISPLMLQNSIETPSPFHTLLSKQSGAEINCHQKIFKLNQNCFVEKNDKKNTWFCGFCRLEALSNICSYPLMIRLLLAHFLCMFHCFEQNTFSPMTDDFFAQAWSRWSWSTKNLNFLLIWWPNSADSFHAHWNEECERSVLWALALECKVKFHLFCIWKLREGRKKVNLHVSRNKNPLDSYRA